MCMVSKSVSRVVGKLLKDILPQSTAKKGRDGKTVPLQPYCGIKCANLAKRWRPVDENVSARHPVKASKSSPTKISPQATTRGSTAYHLEVTASTNARNSSLFTTDCNCIVSTSSTSRRDNRSSAYWIGSSCPLCQTSGCLSPVYVDRHSDASRYCRNCTKAY